ncbi:MAG: DUF11 domain-containing protein [Acidimicrobiales bacterium]|nr:DUF11 domain-containing protein [Acidimicrobiales bacterium]
MFAVAILASLLVVAPGLPADPAQAGPGDNFSLSITTDLPEPHDEALIGEQFTYTLTATGDHVSASPLYNLSFRAVLPAGIGHVSATPAATEVLVDVPSPGETTIIWSNTNDLPANSIASVELTVDTNPDFAGGITGSATAPVGSTINLDAEAAASLSAFTIPDYDLGTGAFTADFDGSATATDAVDIVAFRVLKSGTTELLRGVHQNGFDSASGTTGATYTVTVENNPDYAVDAVTLTDTLDPALEFLGCDDYYPTDNTTVGEEWTGSGAVATGSGCAPSALETPETVDTDGSGQTIITWDLGNLAAGASESIPYRAGIALFENAPFGGSPPSAAGLGQGRNLDNNTGPSTGELDRSTNPDPELLTANEQALTTAASASGTYTPTSSIETNDDTFSIEAEDIIITKSMAGSLSHGTTVVTTLTISTSEYRDFSNLIVRDLLPSALCFLGTYTTDNTSGGSDWASTDCTGAGTVQSTIDGLPVDVAEVRELPDGGPYGTGRFEIVWDYSDPENAALTNLDADGSITIAYTAVVRDHYRGSLAQLLGEPVLAGDRVTNEAEVSGPDTVADVSLSPDPVDPDGGRDGDTAWSELANSLPSIDKRVSAKAGPLANGAGATGATCASAHGSITWTQGDPTAELGFGPGDIVCFEIGASFPISMNYEGVQIEDLLPPSYSYVAGSAARIASTDTLPGTSVTNTATSVTFAVDGTGAVGNAGNEFLWVIAAELLDPSLGQSLDINANLEKLVHNNNGGLVYQYRDQAAVEWTEPQVRLATGVDTVNAGGSNGPDFDGSLTGGSTAVTVRAGDVVTYRIDVWNEGAADAINTEVQEVLPSEADCTMVSSISGSGTCSAGVITWTGLTVAASVGGADTTPDDETTAPVTLTYDLTVPTTIDPSKTWVDNAGVATYQAQTNTGTFDYYPASNIDPANSGLENTDAADDPAYIVSPAPSLAKAQWSGIAEAGNSTNGSFAASAEQATIGEIVQYQLHLTVPHGTSIYNSSISDVLPAGVTYFTGMGLFDGTVSNLQPTVTSPSGTAALTAGAVVHSSGTVTYDLPASHTNAAGSGDDELIITFYAIVDDVPGNVGGGSPTTLSNAGSYAWEDQGGSPRPAITSNSVDTQVVEPDPAVVKDHTVPAGAAVTPGQTVTYRVTVTNPSAAGNVSTAHDIEIVDTVPVGLTPLDISSSPVTTNGDLVASTGVTPVGSFNGTWSEDFRTITWTSADWTGLESVAPDGTIQFTYDVQVDDPAVASTTLTNTAGLTAHTLDQTLTPTDDPNEGSARSYSDSDGDTVNLPLASITKDIEPFNPGDAGDDIASATVGEPVDYELEVTVPSGTVAYDTTIFDQLPATLDFDSFGTITPSPECEVFDSVGGVTTGVSLVGGDIETFNPAGGNAQVAAWFVGDVYADGVCTITVEYTTHVNGTAVDTDTVTNDATISWNTSDAVASQSPGSLDASYDDPSSPSWSTTDGPASETFTVTEPAINIDKDVSTTSGAALSLPTCDTTPGNNSSGGNDADGVGGNGCDTSAGQQIRYTVTVSSVGTSDAHDITVVDTVPVGITPLLNPGGAPATTNGQTITGNSGSTGTWSESSRTITWSLAGPIAPAASATIDYDVQVDPSDTILRNADLTNTADVTTYFGFSTAERTAITTTNPANDDIITYGNDVAATRGAVTTDSVIVEVHFPDLDVAKAPTSGDPTDVRLDQPFSWTITVTNADPSAPAYNVDISDTLPAGWTYDASSAQVTTPHNGGPVQVEPVCTPDSGSCGDAGSLNSETLDWADLVSGIGEPLGPGQTITIVLTATPQSAALTPDQLTGETYTGYDSGAGFAHTNNVSTAGEDATTSATCCDPDGAGPTPPEDYADANTDDVHIARADLEVTKTIDPIEVDADPANGPYWYGSYVEYTITVTNNGPDQATNVTVADVLDAVGLAYDSVVSADQGAFDDGTNIWTIGTIADGAAPQLVLRTRLTALGGITNVAQAHTSDQYDSDSIPGNDQGSEDDQDSVAITSTPVTLGDFVWLDLNGDGVQDPGEPGIPGVQLDLTWTDPVGAPQSYSTTTASDGSYTVPPAEELPADTDITVAVNVGASPNLSGLTPSHDHDGIGSANTATEQVTAADGTDGSGVLADLDFDFGYVPDGNQTIGDIVWWDQNNSGDATDGAGEPSLPGIGVTATWAGWDDVLGNADDLTFTDTTDASGNYLFDLAPPGEYRVAIEISDVPAGMSPTYDLDGTGSPHQADITLDPAETQADIDFSYTGAGTIGDTVWFDHDGDGSIDPGEPGIGGATVTLDWMTATLTTTTAADGTYAFDNLPYGVHTITVDDATLPGAMVQTFDSDGTGTAHTSDVTLNVSTPSNADQDFGYRGTGSIGDTVFFDIDASEADGVPDSGDSGVSGIAMTVTWAGADNTFSTPDDFSIVDVTDGSGSYLVSNLPHGDYTIVLDETDLPAGLITATYDADGTGTLHTSATTLDGGTPDDLAQDFAYTGVVTGLIGDRVWLDQNNNGVDDPGEVGISGVTVTLVWFGDNGVPGGGDDVTQTTTTDAVGAYSFDNLPDGNYTVTVDDTDLPAGLTPTVDADGIGTAHTSATNLGPSNPSSLDQDFGYTGLGSLGDLVWYDVDASGTVTPDVGEPGLPGVEVTVVWTNPQGSDATYVATTDAFGAWAVPNLPYGNYSVTVDDTDLPGGMTPTYDADGTGSAHSSTATLSALTPDVADQDFSYTGTGSLGDTVWFDQDNDGAADPAGSGVFDGQDQPLAGVDLTITWSGSDGVLETSDDVVHAVTTDANGEWQVTSLPYGPYSVVVDAGTLPSGITVATFDADGILTAGSSIVTLDLTTPDNLDQDFSYTGAGALGDTVWLDLDADGTVDPGEVGFAGITVTAEYTGPDGSIVTVVETTDTSGVYSVGQLPFDTPITVTVDDAALPGGLTPTYDGDGVSSAHVSVTTLTLATPTDLDEDFGYNGDGSIGDTVFYDRDGDEDDGVPDADDVGIPNVDVTIGWTNPTGGDDLAFVVTTDPNGGYSLDGLPYGDYTVTVDPATLPAGTIATYDADGTGTALTSATTLDAITTDDQAQDFAVTGTGSLGDLVWTDDDADETKDTAEFGTDGVVVAIVYTDPTSGLTFSDEVTTDADGGYGFYNIPAGEVAVTVDTGTLPAGSVPTHDLDGIDSPNAVDLTLGPGEEELDVDFGYRPEADLAISKTSAGEFAIGATNTWTIAVTNDGPAPAASPVVVTDTLPKGITFVSTSSNDWECAASGQNVTCTFVDDATGDPIDMASGSASTFELSVDVAAAAATGVTNTATVSSNTADPDESDNTDSDEVSIPLSVLDIDKSINGTLQAGTNSTYVLTVTNLGPSPTRGDVVATDDLPSALSYRSYSTTAEGASCSESGGVVTCTNPNEMAVGEIWAVNLTLAVSGSGGASVVNNAEVEGGNLVAGSQLPPQVIEDVYREIADGDGSLAGNLGISPGTEPDGQDGAAGTIIAADPSLARTGATVLRLAGLALVLIAAGALLLYAQRVTRPAR